MNAKLLHEMREKLAPIGRDFYAESQAAPAWCAELYLAVSRAIFEARKLIRDIEDEQGSRR